MRASAAAALLTPPTAPATQQHRGLSRHWPIVQCGCAVLLCASCVVCPFPVRGADACLHWVYDGNRLLEGAEDCLLSASGMCSATTMLLALVPPGGHIVTTTDCYRRTRQFIQTVLPKMGITVRTQSVIAQSVP